VFTAKGSNEIGGSLGLLSRNDGICYALTKKHANHIGSKSSRTINITIHTNARWVDIAYDFRLPTFNNVWAFSKSVCYAYYEQRGGAENFSFRESVYS
jgi:hypothetical protein